VISKDSDKHYVGRQYSGQAGLRPTCPHPCVQHDSMALQHRVFYASTASSMPAPRLLCQHRVFYRHSRAGGNLEFTPSNWIPACAGMTTRDTSNLRLTGSSLIPALRGNDGNCLCKPGQLHTFRSPDIFTSQTPCLKLHHAKKLVPCSLLSF